VAVLVPIALAGVLLEAGFGPAALTYLADISEAFAADRGRLMGIYSVILGAGYLLGNGLGGVVAQVAYFDGMVYLTILLAAVGMVFVALLMARRAPADPVSATESPATM
jgi:MFS family permease